VRIVVLHSPSPREVREWNLELPTGATVADALAAAGLDGSQGGLAIWGRRCEASAVLREGDRVEACRPLLVDPKVARRERFRKQGARAAGLFARRK
jgi:putative ubiquitin-RnfH superfamily antitoxin RatB of RatAB toxin-antitoxin module